MGHSTDLLNRSYQHGRGRVGRVGYSSVAKSKGKSKSSSHDNPAGEEVVLPASSSNRGKSYFILNKATGIYMEEEWNNAVRIVTSKCEAVHSQINPKIISTNYGTGTAFLKLLIEVIGLNLCKSINNLELFFKNTLFYIEQEDTALQSSSSSSTTTTAATVAEQKAVDVFSDLHSCCKFLEHSKIIEVNAGTNEISLSKFGKAMFSCNLDIDDSIEFYDRLIQVQKSGINLQEYLHLLTILGEL